MGVDDAFARRSLQNVVYEYIDYDQTRLWLRVRSIRQVYQNAPKLFTLQKPFRLPGRVHAEAACGILLRGRGGQLIRR